MDWLSSVDQMFAQSLEGYGDDAAAAAGEEEYPDEDDFYEPGDGDGELGATDASPKNVGEVNGANVANGITSNQNNFLANSNFDPPTPKFTTEMGKMTENQKKAEFLRAKLLAKRQGTPVKQQQQNGSNTPARDAKPGLGQESPALKIELKASSGDKLGLESLLAEGKAAAEAKDRQQAATGGQQQQPEPTQNSRDAMPPPQSRAEVHAKENQVQKHKPVPAAPKQTPASSTEEQSKTKFNKPSPQQLITDDYYVDLPLWLEMTGFHDVDYRNSKLRTFKERQSLEAEAAKIQERLEKLREDEQAAIQALRSTPTPRPTANHAPPPVLPKMMPPLNTSPIDQVQPAANGVKRAHSPDPAKAAKTRRQVTPDGYRIRGGFNGSPDQREPHPRGRARSRSPRPNGAADRREFYNEVRRYSPEDRIDRATIRPGDDRDPSLERRRSYYQSYQPEPLAGRRESYDRPPGRGDHAVGGRRGRGRGGYGQAAGREEYRGHRDIDLGGGGVRYFIIKSWNHENVTDAMRDGLWATQEKNEEVLTFAYHNSRHVVLLFSVNKSTAFQGYALMNSPPDPSLPKPIFCTALRWKTSPAFKLRWLATSSVPYRKLGGLKNQLNLDDNGKPLAVFIGYDGQEIEAEAGKGVVEILEGEEERTGGGV